MHRCKTCGLVLPADARICGRCGQAVVVGPPVLGTLVGQGQPPMAKVPIAQGTPQMGSVPVAHGTSLTSSAQGAMASSLHAQHIPSSPGLHVDIASSQPSYPPTPYYHWHRNKRPKVPFTRWLTILIASVVIIVGIAGGLALLLPPIISLSSSVVRQGDTLHLHGSGFIPGSGVSLTLDNHLPLLEQANSQAKAIQVSMNGTFEVAILVSQNWHLGTHTINAMENISVRSAEVSFTIVALPGKLSITPSGLDFGMLQKGSTATQILTISNTGQQPFDWKVNVGNTAWLSLDTSIGTLQPGVFQTIHVTADATSLSAGNHSATLVVSEGSESLQVEVTLEVTPTIVPTPTPAPTIPSSPTQPSVPTRPPTPTTPPTSTTQPKPTPTAIPTPTPTRVILPPPSH
jgi:hypothetical protein